MDQKDTARIYTTVIVESECERQKNSSSVILALEVLMLLRVCAVHMFSVSLLNRLLYS